MFALLWLGLAPLGSAAPSVRVTAWRLDFVATNYVNVPPGRQLDRRLRDAAMVVRTHEPDILLLTGLRDRMMCDRFIGLLKTNGYRTAVCSKFKAPIEREDARQVAIITRHPVLAMRAEDWVNTVGGAVSGGFAHAVIQVETNTFFCYAAQMPGDPSLRLSGPARMPRQRERAAVYLLEHAARMQTRYPDPRAAVIMAGDFHSDGISESENSVPRLLERAGFQTVFQSIAMPRRFEGPGLAPATPTAPQQWFDTIVTRGTDFFSVPQIGGTRFTAHLPVSCELAMSLRPASVPEPIVRVDWARLRQTITAPWFRLPAPVRHLMVSAAVLVLIALLWRFWRRQGPRPGSAVLLAQGRALAGGFVPQIDLPRPTGETVFVTEPANVGSCSDSGGMDRSEVAFWRQRALAAEQRAQHASVALRSRVMPELLRLMKDKVLTMLGAQRARLIVSQETGTQQVLHLEQRLEQIHQQFQDSVRSRDRRIAELEGQLSAREKALRDLGHPSPVIGKQVHD